MPQIANFAAYHQHVRAGVVLATAPAPLDVPQGSRPQRLRVRTQRGVTYGMSSFNPYFPPKLLHPQIKSSRKKIGWLRIIGERSAEPSLILKMKTHLLRMKHQVCYIILTVYSPVLRSLWSLRS